MTLRSHSLSFLLAALFLYIAAYDSRAQDDPGRGRIGEVEVTVYFATDGDPGAAGKKAQEVSEATKLRLQREERLRFSHYRAMGADTQPVFRSYENWAQPLKPSDEILVRFDTSSQPREGYFSVDLELWLARKKILKTDVGFQPGRPLFVLGPEWRGGRLIVAVSLARD